MIRMTIEIEGLDDDFQNTARYFEDKMSGACRLISGSGVIFRAEKIGERVVVYEGA